jgi:hypothetical protein
MTTTFQTPQQDIWLITNRDMQDRVYDTRHITGHREFIDYIYDRKRTTPPLLWAQTLRENAQHDQDAEHFLDYHCQQIGNDNPSDEELCKAVLINQRSGSFQNDKAHLITQALLAVPVETVEFIKWLSDKNLHIAGEYEGLHY